MDYHLITCTSPTTFDVEINGHLKHGWILYYGPFTDPRSGALCQAVVKSTQATTSLLETIAVDTRTGAVIRETAT